MSMYLMELYDSQLNSFTPTILSGGTGTISNNNCTYSKFGHIIVADITFTFTLSTAENANLAFSLPFKNGSTRTYGMLAYSTSSAISPSEVVLQAPANGTGFTLYKNGSSIKGNALSTNTAYRISGTLIYYAA